MNSSETSEPFAGLISTADLVGREELRRQIANAITEPGRDLRIVFLTGEGGIGKTRLLQEVLDLARSQRQVKAARELLDFYHIQNHTANGLVDAIYGLLGPLDEPFHEYEKAHRAWERARLTGEVSGLREQREAVLDAFAKDFSGLVASQRVVLAMDTAERLVYGLGTGEGETSEQIAEVWGLLIDMVRKWQNVTLLVAGRKQANSLRDHLGAHANGALKTLEVEPFSLDESQAYFAAVAQQVRTQGRDRTAVTIENMASHYGYIAHHLAGGKPILLALILEEIAFGGVLPDLIRAYGPGTQPEEAELAGQRTQLEASLFDRLMGNSDYGELIRSLGRAPKGVDADLLAHLLEIDRRDAERRLARLREGRLSFVKVRPSDQRVFLHDEMYDLLYRHVYAKPANSYEANKAAAAIKTYYTEKLSAWRTRLDEIWRPVEIEGKDRIDRQRLAEELARGQALMSEIVYYRLRHQPEAGFRRYYRYMREAVLGGDILLDIQLQVELKTYMEAGGKLAPDVINGIILMRPLVRAFAEQDNKEVVEEAEQARIEKAAILGGSPINAASLATWEASARIYLGGEDNLRAAFEDLDEAIEEVSSEIRSPALARTGHWQWRAQAVLALAYRVRAYGRWTQGAMEIAEKDYREAVTLFRRLNFQVELATALNDLGFVLAERGEWDDARAVASEAYGIRRRLGHRVTMAMSQNTLAAIDMLDGNYERAIDGAEKALAIFRALENKRGTGFALRTLAESGRRHSGTDFVPDPERKIENLRKARDYAREALQIFTESPERLRLVQAHLEIGCACRDWVRVRMEHPSPRDNVDDLVVVSQAQLQKAANLAKEVDLIRHVDALVNLAWLGLYAGRVEIFREGIEAAELVIFPEGRPEKFVDWKDQVPDERKRIWAQLGKLHVLFGHGALYALSKRSEKGDEYEDFWLRRYSPTSPLADAAYYYTVSLWCDAHYGKEYRDLQRAKAEIQARFLALESFQRKAFVEAIAEIETEYGLGESELHTFLKRRTLWDT